MRPGSRSTAAVQRIRVAELTSAIGAGVLGLGLGALLPSRIRALAMMIVAVGAALHAWGMTDKHRLESGAGRQSVWWSTALYWTCWLLLTALAGWVVARLVT
jgi:hypothetical protein